MLVVSTHVAPLSQQPGPHLDTHDPEDEEDEEAEEEDVTEHGECVQQQHDQDPHTCSRRTELPTGVFSVSPALTRYPVDGPQRPEHADCPDGRQVDCAARELPVVQQSEDGDVTILTILSYTPGQHYEAVQLVPTLSQIAAFPKDSESNLVSIINHQSKTNKISSPFLLAFLSQNRQKLHRLQSENDG